MEAIMTAIPVSAHGAILTIYDWKSELDMHWLSPIVNQDNVIVAVDMGAANAREVKRMIDRSFTEQKIRFQTEHKDGEQMDASSPNVSRIKMNPTCWLDCRNQKRIVPILFYRFPGANLIPVKKSLLWI